MTRRLSPVALCAITALLISSAVAFADPAGKTTLEETIRFQGSLPDGNLVRGPGEKTVVRKNLAKPRKSRTRTRRTIGFFGTMTDPQIMDEMSPARAELIDPSGSPFASAWRPHEFGALQNFDQLVRNMNANRRSPVRQGNGKRAKMRFVLNTGDMADSTQLNEVQWYIDVLEGRPIDPFTGEPIGPGNTCDQANDEQKAQLNAAVAARQYTGVQDYDDWRGEPADKYDDFWDPEEAPPGANSPYAAWPRYPGLMERAQRPFDAQGLKVPWYTARGNHDVLWQGTFRAPGVLAGLTTSCLKVFPNDKFQGDAYGGDNASNISRDLADPNFLGAQLGEVRLVPPDPDRRFLYSSGEYQKLHAGADNAHGFGFVSSSEKRKSKGAAAYYAFTRNGVRYIAIDTNAEGGAARGNVDDPQYRWLERELRSAQRKGLLVIGFSHHPLRSQTAKVTDEEAPRCETRTASQCDPDPRRSTPIHRGLVGSKSMKKLFLKYPNFIAYVVGHIHENEIKSYRTKRGTGFWEIATASEIDWPQQGRLIELMNNRDGTLSIFGTMVDTAAPIAEPPPGNAANFSDLMISSLTRQLGALDPQEGILGTEESHSEGKRTDRNVELLIRDPRRR